MTTRPALPLLHVAALAAMLALAACASKPPPPDWQMNAHAAMDRALTAQLSGDSRLEALEFERARQAIASTGRPALMARAELMRCAALVASLQFQPCERFDALQPDADAADLAYARYLAAQPLAAADVALLPDAQRPFASTTAGAHAAGPADAQALLKIDDPLSRLVAAGVLMRSGQAHPAVMAVAVDAASAQGWRRPLLAWLNVQLRVAEQNTDNLETQRLKRRIALVQQTPR
jgi:hypothetical protein